MDSRPSTCVSTTQAGCRLSPHAGAPDRSDCPLVSASRSEDPCTSRSSRTKANRSHGRANLGRAGNSDQAPGPIRRGLR